MEQTIDETRPKTPEEQWKDFMPPDDYVPEWKKQIQATDKQFAMKKIADRALYAFTGFTAATLLSFVPNMIIVQLIVLGSLGVVALASAFRSVQMRLKAVELDNKLNEDVRIEPLVKTGTNTMSVEVEKKA